MGWIIYQQQPLYQGISYLMPSTMRTFTEAVSCGFVVLSTLGSIYRNRKGLQKGKHLITPCKSPHPTQGISNIGPWHINPEFFLLLKLCTVATSPRVYGQHSALWQFGSLSSPKWKNSSERGNSNLGAQGAQGWHDQAKPSLSPGWIYFLYSQNCGHTFSVHSMCIPRHHVNSYLFTPFHISWEGKASWHCLCNVKQSTSFLPHVALAPSCIFYSDSCTNYEMHIPEPCKIAFN